MKMNSAEAVVLENDDPRVDAVVVLYASTTQLQRGIYILHNRDIFHFLKCHILCSSMSVIYIMLATHLIYDNTKRCSKMQKRSLARALKVLRRYSLCHYKNYGS